MTTAAKEIGANSVSRSFIKPRSFWGLAITASGIVVGLLATQDTRYALLAATIVALAPAAVALSLAAGHHLARERVVVSSYLPLILVILSTLVFRQRDAAALAENPLDSAGLFRVACIGLAFLLVGARLSLRNRDWRRPILPLGIHLYAAYVLVVFVGAALSSKPFLTAYRGAELVVGILVVLLIWQLDGARGIKRAEAVLFWGAVVLLLITWLGAVLFPAQALIPFPRAPIPVRLFGVFPVLAHDDVGFFGTIVALWSLGKYLRPSSERAGSPLLYLVLSGFGAVSLVAAQYRTGYVALILGIAVLLALHRRNILAVGLVALLLVIAFMGPRASSQAETLVLRGQSYETVATLNGRVRWWQAALPLWRQSPIVGTGLRTGTRFEVLDQIGRSTTSTIHNTWVEVLVGTGVVGLLFFLSAYLAVAIGILRRALARGGRAIPLVLLVALSVRTITATTFETSHYWSLIFLVLSFGSLDESRNGGRNGVSGHGAASNGVDGAIGASRRSFSRRAL